MFDCDTRETALDSLSRIMDVAAEDIDACLRTWPFEDFEREAQQAGGGGYEAAREKLWRLVFGRRRPVTPTEICWFHATRNLRGTTYVEGLLPLNEAKVLLLERLGAMGLRPLRSVGGFHDLAHKEKLAFSGSLGPHGHLVREASFAAEQNHFFNAPEMIVDLGYDLRAYREATVPCIVKFRVAEPDEHIVEPALFYVYLTAWGQRTGYDCSWTWSGNGSAVPRADILRVDVLSDEEVSVLAAVPDASDDDGAD